MNMFERRPLVLGLTKYLAQSDASEPLAMRLCRAATHLLRLDGGAITVGWATPARATICATDPVAARLNDLQEVVGDGPSYEADRTQTTTEASANAIRRRWPLFAHELRRHLGEEPYLLSLPMRPESANVGILSMYASVDPEPPNDLVQAQFLADAIGFSILADWKTIASSLDTWSARDKVNQAAGMVVAQLNLEPRDAVAVLRAHAYAIDGTLEDVVELVLRRELDFATSDGNLGWEASDE